MSELVIATPL